MREQTSPVLSLWRGFLWPGRYAGYCARDTMPLLLANRRSGAPGRTVGEVVDNF